MSEPWVGGIMPPEKPRPVVGMEVVCPNGKPGAHHPIRQGARGVIYAVYEYDLGCRLDGVDYGFPLSSFGTELVPAAEWDATHCRHGKRVAVCVGRDSGKAGQVAVDGEWRDPGSIAKPDNEKRCGYVVAGGSRQFLAVGEAVLCHQAPDASDPAFLTKLAVALFESDNAGTIARVADDGQGGIGTAATRERLVWMSAEPQREAYLREAAALLGRVTEMP